MPYGLKLRFWNTRVRRGGTEAGMWSPSTVVRCPDFEGLLDVGFVERNREVEALATGTADQALANAFAWGDL